MKTLSQPLNKRNIKIFHFLRRRIIMFNKKCGLQSKMTTVFVHWWATLPPVIESFAPNFFQACARSPKNLMALTLTIGPRLAAISFEKKVRLAFAN